jgi:prepilin-type N-terminal cleavage/methylation domain-containing protein
VNRCKQFIIQMPGDIRMIHINRHKAQNGFTLVEVIVVAIIVAALAAVAVPLYLNYVGSSRDNSASNAAGSIASFCGACVNAAGNLTDNSVAAGGGSISCSNGSNIQIPTDIVVTLNPGNPGDPAAVPPVPPSARGVTAHHTQSTNNRTFNY